MNTILFKIGDKEWPNKKKQSMLGRTKLQSMLRKMVKAGCTHAVFEVTSEGILQHRQWGIAFDVVVFTNLSEEHVEAHGTYRKYREAKELIFKNLRRSYRKTIKGREIPKIIAVNGDDKEADEFFKHRADKKWVVYADCKKLPPQKEKESIICAENIKETKNGVAMTIDDRYIDLQMHGKFMAHNALLATATAQSLGISLSTCEQALEKITMLPGRVEIITTKKGVRVIVDYAHEPKSFLAIFNTARELVEDGKVLVVFGATGGGRDKRKRGKMGKLAAEFGDYVILTTDDPYDDDPLKIIEDIAPGVISARPEWSVEKELFKIVDRKKAIQKALKLAKPNDIVLLLGKGSEQTMAVAEGRMVNWSDAEVVRELIS